MPPAPRDLYRRRVLVAWDEVASGVLQCLALSRESHPFGGDIGGRRAWDASQQMRFGAPALCSQVTKWLCHKHLLMAKL
jgi:hypothetical protein